ncbi:60S ribosomal protein l9 [Pseudohyphozyma bogoriensis]|nr:60S ribosomal protein l9 [Pseudohyphozyma bogoriensis]
MTAFLNHYVVLGLDDNRTASDGDVRKAYLDRAKKLHPDRVPADIKDKATVAFQKLATAYAVLMDPTSRRQFDLALKLEETRASAGPISTLATYGSSQPRGRSPSPSRRPASPSPSSYRPSSPSGRARSPSPRPYGYGSFATPSVNWVDPMVNPFAMFDEVLREQERYYQAQHAQSYGGGRGVDDTYGQRYQSRIGNRGTLTDQLDKIMSRDDPLRRDLPNDLFANAAAGMTGHGGPWGRHFDGAIEPGRGGRGRKMSTSFREGEKHRNGDFRIRNQHLNVEEMDDGTVRWSSSAIEITNYSGSHGRTRATHSHSQSQSFPGRPPTPTNDYSRPRSSSRSRSSSLGRLPAPQYQAPTYPAIDYQAPTYPAIDYQDYGARPALPAPAPQRPLACRQLSLEAAPQPQALAQAQAQAQLTYPDYEYGGRPESPAFGKPVQSQSQALVRRASSGDMGSQGSLASIASTLQPEEYALVRPVHPLAPPSVYRPTSSPAINLAGGGANWRDRKTNGKVEEGSSCKKMKQIYKEEELDIPEGVTVSVKARIITVTGPRGTLVKNAQHVDMSIRVIHPSEKAVKPISKVKLVVWHGGRKHVACLRTIRSMIENMIQGVRYGFSYKMRLVYAHFPINVIISDDKQSVEIRNFLGEKIVRHVPMLEGVTISESTAQKDEIILQGNDVDNVSQSAASIHISCLVKNKDIRKFLDGIYVSEKTTVDQPADEE